jgi:hypothetical protein
MAEDLRPEIADVEAEDGALAHRAVAPRRGPHPAVGAERDAPDRRQPAAEIRVLAVKLDARIESADRRERVAADREVPPVENRADAQQMVDERVRRRRDEEVVRADQRAGRSDPSRRSDTDR